MIDLSLSYLNLFNLFSVIFI